MPTSDDEQNTNTGSSAKGSGGKGNTGSSGQGRSSKSNTGAPRKRSKSSTSHMDSTSSRARAGTGDEAGPEIRHEASGDEAHEGQPGERVPRSVMWDPEVLELARAAATYLGAYVPESHVESLADVVELGVRMAVDKLEKEWFDGQHFPKVKRMRPGRRYHNR